MTDRLLIRKFVSEDWSDIYEYLSDEEVIRFEPYEAMTKEQVRVERKNE